MTNYKHIPLCQIYLKEFLIKDSKRLNLFKIILNKKQQEAKIHKECYQLENKLEKFSEN